MLSNSDREELQYNDLGAPRQVPREDLQRPRQTFHPQNGLNARGSNDLQGLIHALKKPSPPRSKTRQFHGQ